MNLCIFKALENPVAGKPMTGFSFELKAALTILFLTQNGTLCLGLE